MSDSEDEVPTAPLTPDQGVWLFLALYLLLLAFFILLNAISETADARVSAAVKSVKEAFQDRRPESDEFVDIAENPESLLVSEDYIENVKAVFSTSLNETGFHESLSGDLLRVSVPMEVFFPPGSATMQPSVSKLFEALAASLSAPVSGERRQLEIVLGTGSEMPGGSDVGNALEIRRAGSLARALRARGLPPGSLTTGVHPGDPEIMEMTFYTRKIRDTQVTFEDLVSQ